MQKRTLLFAFGAMAVRPANALYDPKPSAHLELATGTWVGSLTYRDYQKPDKMVTLKASMIVSLLGPEELALYYVFDDGPGKTVYSYERMKFELTSSQLLWNSGTANPTLTECKITASSFLEGKSSLAFEKKSDMRIDRYSFEVTKSTWLLAKFEVSAEGVELLRSSYAFSKRDA